MTLQFKNAKETGEIVGPERAVRCGFDAEPIRLSESGFDLAVRNEDAPGGFEAAFGDGSLVEIAEGREVTDEAERFSEIRDERGQFEMAAGEVKREDALGHEFLAVKFDRFEGEKMHRNDIGTERVDVEQTENVVRHFLEAQAGIAKLHLERGAIAVAQVSEERWVLGDANDRGIDLENGPGLVGLRIGEHCASAEADQADVAGKIRLFVEGGDFADGPQAVIIGTGVAIALGGAELNAVNGRAVVEASEWFLGVVDDTQNAEEISVPFDDAALGLAKQCCTQEQRGDRDCVADWPQHQQVAPDEDEASEGIRQEDTARGGDDDQRGSDRADEDDECAAINRWQSNARLDRPAFGEADDRRNDDHERVFENRLKKHGRKEGVENSTEHTADGEPQIECCELFGGAGGCEPA